MTRPFVAAVRHPAGWLRDICGGESAFPLVVLFGLNAVDELDRTAFGILLPNIRDDFHLDNTKVLGLVALVVDRRARVAGADRPVRRPVATRAAGDHRRARVGLLQRDDRVGHGCDHAHDRPQRQRLGKAVIDPTHNSLLADYYPIETRSRVFSTHRAANAVGSFVGPLSAGLLAFAFGWRVPFIVFVVPTLIFAVIALRLREPVRGQWERQAMGANEDVIATEETVPSFAESWRTVQKIGTLQAAVVEPAVPRDGADRVRRARVAAVRAAVRARRTRPGHRRRDRRTASSWSVW